MKASLSTRLDVADTDADVTGDRRVVTAGTRMPMRSTQSRLPLTSIKIEKQRPSDVAPCGLPQAAASASTRAASSKLMLPGMISMAPSRSSLVKVRLTVSMVMPR